MNPLQEVSKGGDFSQRGHFPQAGKTVRTSYGQELSVRRKSSTQPPSQVQVWVSLTARGHVPEQTCTSGSDREAQLLIRREGSTAKWTNVRSTLPRLRLLPCAQIPLVQRGVSHVS